MQPEIKKCIEEFLQLDDDCVDALLASQIEENEGKRKLLNQIYKDKCAKRGEYIKLLEKLCQTK